MRSFPKSPHLNRRLGKVRPLSQVFCFCEGRTEKKYIEEYASAVGRILIEIIVLSDVGVPKTIVDVAIKKQNELRALASRRGADSFARDFQVWAVFDRDQHPLFAESVERALSSGVKTAYSVPCVEVWALLHILDLGTGAISTRDAQKKLEALMPSYSHSHSPYFHYNSIRNAYQDARSRAVRLERLHEQVGDKFGCPSTTIYHLTDLIGETSKIPPRRLEKSEELKARISQIEADNAFLNGDRDLIMERQNCYELLKTLV